MKRKLTIFCLFLVCGMKTQAEKKFMEIIFNFIKSTRTRSTCVVCYFERKLFDVCYFNWRREFHEKQWLWILWLFVWRRKSEQFAAFEEELIQFLWIQMEFSIYFMVSMKFLNMKICSTLWLVICKESWSSINLILFFCIIWYCEYYLFAQLLTFKLYWYLFYTI